ncbi:MFS transporter [Streptomyces sp. NBC_00525]|uniref:MFS transporter n=1 Tax=Streptomyces sp. NBC_00525 TaxID=2903660 RepID=UPI002E80D262|nr:MFS transporter [Streptomyces sp. NBC_00525]WUC96883.1 MFS transporter [Streptomyces sp. NBC_00525]
MNTSSPTDPARRSTAASSGARPESRTAVAALGMCVMLVFGLGAGVNLAVGRLATSALRPTPTEVLWIVDSYLIVFGCLLIPSGAVGDRFGRKGALLTGLAMMVVGSLASAVSPTVPLLLGARAVTGAGAALILPNSLPLLISCFPSGKRGQAVALWTALSGGGGVAGNIVGGAVLQFYDWQVLFAVAAPLSACGLAVAARTLPRVERHAHLIDTGGILLLVAAVFGVLFGIIEGSELGWASPAVLSGFATSAVFLVLFCRYELGREQPLLDPRVFRRPGMRAGTLGIVASFVAMYSVFYLNGQYLMNVKDYPAVLAGLGTAPLAVVIFLVSLRAALLADRYGGRPVIACGLLVVVVGLGLFSLCGPGTAYVVYAGCIVVVGIGSGLSNPPLSNAVITSVPAHQAGVGSGINSFSREIGGALGFAVFGTLLNTRFANALPAGPWDTGDFGKGQALGTALRGVEQSGTAAAHLSAQVREAFTTGMAESLRIVALALLLLTIVVVLWLRPGHDEHGTTEGKP